MAPKTKNLEKNLEKLRSEEAEVPEQPDVEPPTKNNKTEPKKKVAEKKKTEPTKKADAKKETAESSKKTPLTKEQMLAKAREPTKRTHFSPGELAEFKRKQLQLQDEDEVEENSVQEVSGSLVEEQEQAVGVSEPEKKEKKKKKKKKKMEKKEKKENEEPAVGEEEMRGTCSQTLDPTPTEEGTGNMDEATGTGNQASNPAEHASSEPDASPQVQEEEDEHMETPAEHSNAEGEEIPQVVEDENEQMKTAAEQQTVIEQRKKKKRKRKRKTKDKEKRKKKTTTESMEEQQEIVEGDQTPIEEGSGNRTGEQTFPGEHANPAVEPNPVEEK